MGLDSVELVMAWEEAFGIPISDSVAATLWTPRHVIDFFESQIRQGPPPGQPLPLPKQKAPGLWRFLAALCGSADKTTEDPAHFRSPLREDLPHAAIPNESLSRAQIADIVRVITLDQIGIDPEEYGEDKLFVDDFGIG